MAFQREMRAATSGAKDAESGLPTDANGSATKALIGADANRLEIMILVRFLWRGGSSSEILTHVKMEG